MPIDPADVDRNGDEVARHYAALELAMLAMLAEELRAGTPSHIVRRKLQRLANSAAAGGEVVAGKAVRRAWSAGERAARAEIKVIEQSAARSRAVQRRVAEATASSGAALPPAARPTPQPSATNPNTRPPVARPAPVPTAGAILGPAQGPAQVTPLDTVRTGQPNRRAVPAAKVAVERATDAMHKGLQTSVAETVARTAGKYEAVVRDVAKAQFAGEANALQVQKRALEEWARKGLPAFVDKSGRTWSNQSYSEMLVRTVTQRAYRDASHATLAAEGFDLVIVSSHRNPAPMCQPYELKVLSLSGASSGVVQVPSALTGEMTTVEVYASMSNAEANGYHHPNCFPADTLTTSPSGIKAADRRWYEGKMVTVHTASGQKLTGTPNHPVLTTEGWIGLGALEEGDKVVRHSIEVEPDTVVNPDDVEVPTPIGEVFSSLLESVEVRPVTVPTSAEDFHGDGVDGDVDIVFTDGLLRNWRQAATLEELGEGQLLVGGVGEVGLLAGRTLLEGVDVVDHAPGGCVSGGCEFEPVLPGGLGVTLGSLLGGGKVNAESGHPLGDLGLVGAEHVCDFCLGVPGLVQGGGVEVVGRGGVVGSLASTPEDGGLLSGEGNASVPKPDVDPALTDSEGGRDLYDALAGEVTLDEIVHIDVSDFAGHVYNLETGSGWYHANSIIVHNCRHTETAFVSDVTRPGGTEPSEVGYEATQQQRYQERKIREWKRRQAVAGSDEESKYAKGKVREWQGNVREHVKVHGLDRRYYREAPLGG